MYITIYKTYIIHIHTNMHTYDNIAIGFFITKLQSFSVHFEKFAMELVTSKSAGYRYTSKCKSNIFFPKLTDT